MCKTINFENAKQNKWEKDNWDKIEAEKLDKQIKEDEANLTNEDRTELERLDKIAEQAIFRNKNSDKMTFPETIEKSEPLPRASEESKKRIKNIMKADKMGIKVL